jgi:hypothetical protein
MGSRQEGQAQAVHGQEASGLNAHHRRGLHVTCQHIDQLLSDMEGALSDTASRRAFPKYVLDVQPAQRRVIHDYIARMRAQLGPGARRPGHRAAPGVDPLVAVPQHRDHLGRHRDRELQPEHMRAACLRELLSALVVVAAAAGRVRPRRERDRARGDGGIGAHGAAAARQAEGERLRPARRHSVVRRAGCCCQSSQEPPHGEVSPLQRPSADVIPLDLAALAARRWIPPLPARAGTPTGLTAPTNL